jgi:hypothetical protein
MRSMKIPSMRSSTSKAVWYTSLAAGAVAGSAAHGAVVYTDVIPDLTAGTISWDLDNGGANDFRIEVAINNNQEKSNLVPLNPDAGIALTPNGNADKMAAGEMIGGVTPFSAPTETKTLFDEAAPANFDWNVGDRGFVGLRVSLNGNIHYGWADISINAVGTSFNHTLYGYAYEDVAQATILAGAVPEPSTALLLVAGAAGAASIRRRRE